MKFALAALAGGCFLFSTTIALAHGFGGATAHPSGGEGASHSASGGNEYHSQGSSSAYHSGTESGTYHPQNESQASGYHPPNESSAATASGYHPTNESSAAMSSGYHPESAQGYSYAHSTQPTEAGVGASFASSGAAGYPASHATQPVNSATLPDQGNAVRQAYNGTGTYNQSWYGEHPDAWHTNGWAAGAEWSGGSWAAVAPAAGVAVAAQPVAYNYGYACTPPPGAQAPASQPAPMAADNYQQSAALAQNAPPANPQSSGWTPLGVFALVRDPASTPHYVMQLAVNKQGALAGNYTDLITDTVKPVHGAVDSQTQRVAWTVGDNKSAVGEAGLYNLTQDQAPAVIHIGPDKTQQWLLVRLKQSQ
jgi:hypothetical protein